MPWLLLPRCFLLFPPIRLLFLPHPVTAFSSALPHRPYHPILYLSHSHSHCAPIAIAQRRLPDLPRPARDEQPRGRKPCFIARYLASSARLEPPLPFPSALPCPPLPVQSLRQSQATLRTMVEDYGRLQAAAIAGIEGKSQQQFLAELPARAARGDMSVVMNK